MKMDEYLGEILEEFMFSPLVTWVKTFENLVENNGDITPQHHEVFTLSKEIRSDYLRLADGLFLNKVMRLIDPNPKNERIYRNEKNDDDARVRNLNILVQHIRTFYQEDLQQLILMPFPSVHVLAKEPLTERGIEEMKRLLLLLLGCAVQCERKEEFIDQIQTLDISTQAAIASSIQEVTQDQKNMLLLQWAEFAKGDTEFIFQNMTSQLKQLLKERDENLEVKYKITVMNQEREGLPSLQSPQFHSFDGNSIFQNAGLGSGENKQHLTVQLADSKAKLRRLRQELEEKCEHLLDYKQVVQDLEVELKKLRQENRDLLSDARLARMYRDELDIAREKAARLERLQNEVKLYKERLQSLEFYKSKLEEEKEYSKALLETKAMLDEELETARAKSDKLHELEKENLFLKSRMNDMEMEQDMERQRMQDLFEDNLSLEVELKRSMSNARQLQQHQWDEEEDQEKDLSLHGEVALKPFSCEVDEVSANQLLILERENQAMRKKMLTLEETLKAQLEKDKRIDDTEKEKEHLSKMLEKLQAELHGEKKSTQNAEELSSDLMKEKERLEKTIQMIHDQAEREVLDLKMENEHLIQTLESTRQRSQISNDARVKDIEKENKVLHDTIMDTSVKMNKLEFDKKQLLRDVQELKEKVSKGSAIEQELERIEKVNEQLQKKIVDQKIMCDKVALFEEKTLELESENAKLKQSLEDFELQVKQLEALEQENRQLEEESLQLQRALGRQKLEAEMMNQLDQKNKELEKEKSQLKKNLELLKVSARKGEQLEMNYLNLQVENQQGQKMLETMTKKAEERESELQEKENEIQTLQKSLEEQKKNTRHLEQEKQTLQFELGQAEKDKKHLEKEKGRLRQQIDVKDSTLDEQTLRITSLEQENKLLSMEICKLKELDGQLKEMEKEIKELLNKTAIDKKTLLSLREELVSEKVKVHERNNTIDKLTQELEKIGLSKDRLLQEKQCIEESNYKMLEHKLESSFKKTLEMKEEQIMALKVQTQSLATLNQQLTEKLQKVMQNNDSLRQSEDIRQASLLVSEKAEESKNIKQQIVQHSIDYEVCNRLTEPKTHDKLNDDYQQHMEETCKRNLSLTEKAEETKCMKQQTQQNSSGYEISNKVAEPERNDKLNDDYQQHMEETCKRNLSLTEKAEETKCMKQQTQQNSSGYEISNKVAEPERNEKENSNVPHQDGNISGESPLPEIKTDELIKVKEQAIPESSTDKVCSALNKVNQNVQQSSSSIEGTKDIFVSFPSQTERRELPESGKHQKGLEVAENKECSRKGETEQSTPQSNKIREENKELFQASLSDTEMVDVSKNIKPQKDSDITGNGICERPTDVQQTAKQINDNLQQKENTSGTTPGQKEETERPNMMKSQTTKLETGVNSVLSKGDQNVNCEVEQISNNLNQKKEENSQIKTAEESESTKLFLDLFRDGLSNRLIDVERNNAALLAEKQALNNQLKQLEVQNENLFSQIMALQKHALSLQEQTAGQQALNSRLQVENSNFSSQNAALMAQSMQAQTKQASVEGENKALLKEKEEMKSMYESLFKDHEKLILLHERQEVEFEATIDKHGKLKGMLRNLEQQHKELEGRYGELLAQKNQLEEKEASLKAEQEKLEKEAKKYRSLDENFQRMKEDFDRLNKTHSNVLGEQEVLQIENKSLKSQLNSLQLEKTRLEADYRGLKEQNQQLDISATKLTSQCELMAQLKSNLEEENRHLLHQIQTLSQENRTLLEKTMESKDQFFEEQRQHMDKLNELRREKQKLVEKIMDQYRVLDPNMTVMVPKSKKSNWIADKMKKFIKPRKEMNKDNIQARFLNMGSTENIASFVNQDGFEQCMTQPSRQHQGSEITFMLQDSSAPSSPASIRKAISIQNLNSNSPKLRTRSGRRFSSRFIGSESFSPGDNQTARDRFRQRRIGWYEGLKAETKEEEKNTSTKSSPSRSSVTSRDSDVSEEIKGLQRKLETMLSGNWCKAEKQSWAAKCVSN
ncbi:girdin-like [Protopterus annectens]|uniref:girdin-like n=1 Tax=Protopterus annectens TaxID=7888 RepID=UPI001CFB2E01|nr:girdin-like [Protopterus annectens]